jgi:hypothetical protein
MPSMILCRAPAKHATPVGGNPFAVLLSAVFVGIAAVHGEPVLERPETSTHLKVVQVHGAPAS